MDIGNQYQWILDSGVSQQVTNNLELLYYRVKIEDTMEMSNETTEKFEIKFKVIIRLDKKTIFLTDVYYLKASKNIIRITKLMYNEFKVIGKVEKFQIIKNN